MNFYKNICALLLTIAIMAACNPMTGTTIHAGEIRGISPAELVIVGESKLVDIEASGSSNLSFTWEDATGIVQSSGDSQLIYTIPDLPGDGFLKVTVRSNTDAEIIKLVRYTIILPTPTPTPTPTSTSTAISTHTPAASSTPTETLTPTANENADDAWFGEHQFKDEFTQDQHGWAGDNEAAHVRVNTTDGVLIFESRKDSKITFWKCDACSLPEDHEDYSFEVKYFAPEETEDFNFGLVFGCEQFDEDLVSCQAIHIVEQSTVIVRRTGINKIYDSRNIAIQPNEKGLVSIRWEVKDAMLKLWINEQLVMKDIRLDGGASGMFGLYSDPPGSTVFIERFEIFPLLQN